MKRFASSMHPIAKGTVFVMNESGNTVSKFDALTWVKGKGPKPMVVA